MDCFPDARIADNEGAKFWLSVMNELKNRGVQDVLIAVVDGLKGFPEAITAAVPQAAVQTSVRHWARTNGAFNGSLHLVRHSLNFCAWKYRKAVAVDQAAAQLDAFEEKWAQKYASIAPTWRWAWQEVIPFFAFDPAIRKIIYTTHAIESHRKPEPHSSRKRSTGSFSDPPHSANRSRSGTHFRPTTRSPN